MNGAVAIADGCRPIMTLRAIKLIHTAAWAVFASAIVLIPVVAWQRKWAAVAILTAIVMVEVTVLAMNGMRCPLTDVAARFTDDRRANFDIYLPLWLATYNKPVFGGLFAAGLLVAVLRAVVPSP